ncbi:MAG: PQQ-like beta-propeller repeat protein [Treponema sp.]|nr:PQQ-like beta-propeller repeat protein [Treponema sp.]MCL2236786.1 PQQ-like beta-propeller repeat protein [Treponema sp.]
MDNQNEQTNQPDTNGEDGKPAAKKPKKPGKFSKFLRKFFITLAVILVAWIAFSMIGRVNAAYVIPDNASIRISISNPVSLLNGIVNHETFGEISSVPALAPAVPFLTMLHTSDVLNHGLIRMAARGNMELALLPEEEDGLFIAAWDLGFLSPLLRILPAISNLVNIPNLYHVQAGKNSRFEFRMDDMTLYIGPLRNLLFITDNANVFESRSALHSGHEAAFSSIKPSSYDAAFMVSNEFISSLMSDLDSGIAAIIENIEFSSKVEAGLSIYPKKIDLHIAAPMSSNQSSLSKILGQRSQVPGMAERIPSDAQYATILSAGTLEELYQAALVFTPGLESALKTADTSSKLLLGLTLNDLLFSWSGNEIAAFGLEGRPHPVYAIQITDERKRHEVFERAFRSIVLNENIRLNLDGTRIPRIELPEFLQSLLRHWNVNIPSPYYLIQRDFMLISESAEALLSASRSMQRNDILPRTPEWRNIAGNRSTASSLSLYYSLDLSVPFFLRNNTAFSGFMSLYKQGLARMSFNRGVVDIFLSLVPGSGNGVNLLNGYPLAVGNRPSNQVFGAGRGENGRVFFTSGGNAVSLNMSDNSMKEISGQGTHWIIPMQGITESAADTGKANSAWIVTDRGRVTLVDGNMEVADGFPMVLGLRLSSPPAAFEGKLYLCDEDGRVYIINENGNRSTWETRFTAAVRSPPSFITVSSRRDSVTYAAVYPKSFIGEIWLLDSNGNAMPNWPAPIAVETASEPAYDADEEGEESGGARVASASSSNSGFGIGFGSPLLFMRNNTVLVAFVNQAGQLFVYNTDASFMEPFPIDLDGVFYHQPVYDGEYLWLVSQEGNFFRVSLDGEVLYQNIPGFSVKEEGFITVFDSNGDKVPEIYFTGEGNALYAFTQNFRSLEGFPLPLWGRPHFVPAQGRANAEIFGMGMSMRLYRYQFR